MISLHTYVNFVRKQEFPITFAVVFSKEMQKKRGDPKSGNDRTVERRNGGVMERRRMTPNPKRWNRGTGEKFPKY